MATVVIGAMLSAPLYWGGHWLAAHGILPFLGDTEFRRFFDRALLLAAVLLLWPTAIWIRVPSIRALELTPNRRRWQDFALGFAASFLMMVMLGLVLTSVGICKMRAGIPWAPLGKIAITAGVVSLLEEWLFRAAILGLLIRGLPAYSALFFTSALYSILHFLKPQEEPVVIKTVGWFSAFSLIPGAFARFSQPLLVLGGFTTLFCVGWILGWARLRTRSLAMPLGLHAGWILGIMGFAKVSRRLVKETLPWFGEDLSVGLCSVLIVLLTGAIVWYFLRNRSAEPEPTPQKA